MRTFFQRIFGFLAWLWSKLMSLGKWLVVLLLAAAIIIVGILVAQSIKDNDSASEDQKVNKPEIAQVFEPSIGTPLPPDTNGNNQEGGAVTTPTNNNSEIKTTTPETNNQSSNSEGKVAGATTDQNFLAPTSGVDYSKPIQYQNDSLEFSLSLEANYNVVENSNTITFTKDGKNILIVSVVKNYQGTLSDVISQLKLASGVTNIQPNYFEGKKGISFFSNKSDGQIVIANNNLYYIIGNSDVYKNISF